MISLSLKTSSKNLKRNASQQCIVIQPSFQDMGGGNKLNITIISELSKRGVEVHVLTIDGFPWGKFKQYWGIELSKVKVHSLLQRKLAKDIVFLLHPLLFLESIYYVYKIRPKLLVYFDDVIGPIFPFLNERTKTLLYIHFPLSIKIKLENIFLTQAQSATLIGKIIFSIKKFLMRLFLGQYSKKANVIICNSSWTRSYVENAWKLNDCKSCKIIFPPVNVEEFNPLPKEPNSIVTVGSIDKGKRPETIIKALKKCQTKPRLHIIGITYRAPQYVKSLTGLVTKLGLEQQISFYPDISFNELKQIVGRSRVIISASSVEAFGIAVVEGMAAGCVPIVYQSGGPWNDIIQQGKYGLGFSTEEELATKIDFLLSDENIFNLYSVLAQERAKCFSDNRFREEIIEVINNFLEGN